MGRTFGTEFPGVHGCRFAMTVFLVEVWITVQGMLYEKTCRGSTVREPELYSGFSAVGSDLMIVIKSLISSVCHNTAALHLI